MFEVKTAAMEIRRSSRLIEQKQRAEVSVARGSAAPASSSVRSAFNVEPTASVRPGFVTKGRRSKGKAPDPEAAPANRGGRAASARSKTPARSKSAPAGQRRKQLPSDSKAEAASQLLQFVTKAPLLLQIAASGHDAPKKVTRELTGPEWKAGWDECEEFDCGAPEEGAAAGEEEADSGLQSNPDSGSASSSSSDSSAQESSSDDSDGSSSSSVSEDDKPLDQVARVAKVDEGNVAQPAEVLIAKTSHGAVGTQSDAARCQPSEEEPKVTSVASVGGDGVGQPKEAPSVDVGLGKSGEPSKEEPKGSHTGLRRLQKVKLSQATAVPQAKVAPLEDKTPTIMDCLEFPNKNMLRSADALDSEQEDKLKRKRAPQLAKDVAEELIGGDFKAKASHMSPAAMEAPKKRGEATSTRARPRTCPPRTPPPKEQESKASPAFSCRKDIPREMRIRAYETISSRLKPDSNDGTNTGHQLTKDLEESLYNFCTRRESPLSADIVREYFAKARALAYSFKHNPDLRQRFVEGKISPASLAAMDSWSLAPAAMQKERQEEIERYFKSEVISPAVQPQPEPHPLPAFSPMPEFFLPENAAEEEEQESVQAERVEVEPPMVMFSPAPHASPEPFSAAQLSTPLPLESPAPPALEAHTPPACESRTPHDPSPLHHEPPPAVGLATPEQSGEQQPQQGDVLVQPAEAQGRDSTWMKDDLSSNAAAILSPAPVPSATCSAAELTRVPFYPGCEVRIVDIISADVNGMSGVIQAFDNTVGRWIVQFRGEQSPRRLKASNMVLVA